MFSQSSWFKYRSIRQYAFKEGCCMTNWKIKECRPKQITIKDNKQKEITPKKKFKSMSIQLREGSIEPDSDGTNILQQHLSYMNEDLKNHSIIDIDTSMSIVTWKLTKNHSHIISNRLFSSYSSYSGNSLRSKLDVESSSIPINHIELFYCLTRRLLFTSKITIPDVLDCVT